MNRYLFLLLFTIHSLSTFGQGDFKQGFIELKDKQVVRGYIKSINGISTNFSCVFKENTESDEINFSPENLISYGYDSGKVYFSKKINFNNDSLFVFAERLIDGRASLFEVLQRFYVQKDTLFLELKNTIEDKESKEYLGILNFILSDCPKIKQHLKLNKSEKYWQNIVKSSIELYNHCADTQQPRLIKINLLPFLGVNYSSTSFSNATDPSLRFYSTSKYFNETPLMVGLDIDISIPKISNTVSLSIGSWYSSTKVNFSSSVSTKFKEVNFSSTDILIPIGMKWVFLNKTKLKSYIVLRGARNIIVSEKSYGIEEVDVNGNIYTYESTFSEAKSLPSWLIGIGCSYELKKVRIFIEANYLNKNSRITFPSTGNQELNKTTKGEVFSLGIKF